MHRNRISQRQSPLGVLVLFCSCVVFTGCAREQSPNPQAAATNWPDPAKQVPIVEQATIETNGDNQPVQSDSSQRQPDPTTSPEKNKPEFVLTTNDLVGGQFGLTREGVEEKYVGKRLELSGTIKAFGTQRVTEGDTKLTLFASIRSKNSESEYGVLCYFQTDELPWKQFLPGEAITVRGQGKSDGSFYLNDCTFVSRQGNRTPVLTADELAQEFDADEQKTVQKYAVVESGTPWLVIKGVVSSTSQSRPDSFQADFKHGGKSKLTAMFLVSTHQFTKEQFAAITKISEGDDVVVLGIPSSFAENGKFWMTSCWLLEHKTAESAGK